MENCFLCQKSTSESKFHRTPSKTSSIYSKWKKSYSKSLCRLLNLNPISFQAKFLEVTYCTTCLQIIRDIDFSIQTVSRLQDGLKRSRRTVEALLKESFQKMQSGKWIKQEVILPQESLNSDGSYDHSAEYSYMINAIFDWKLFASNSENSSVRSVREPSEDRIPSNDEADVKLFEYEQRDSRLRRVSRSTPTYNEVELSDSESEQNSDCDSDFMPTVEAILGDEDEDSEVEVIPEPVKEKKKVVPAAAAAKRRMINKYQYCAKIAAVQKKNRNSKLIRSLAFRSRPKISSVSGQANNETKLVCNFDKTCRFTTTRKVILDGHVNGEHKGDSTPFHCPDCAGSSQPSKFSSITRYYCHRREVHQANVLSFSCETCKKTFRTKWELTKHLKMAHVKRTSQKLRCTQCKKLFDEERKAELEEHEELHKLRTLAPFSCVICDTQDFTNFHDLSVHVNQEHEGLLKCEICSRTYNTQKALKKHIETSHGEKSRIWKCPQADCPFSARCRTTLGRHIETHSNEKNYVCDQCPKAYKSKSCLMYHIRAIHTKELKWKCKLCPKSFPGSAPLKAHEESHNTTKNYFCEKCGKAFRAKKNLAQHMRSHSETNKIPRQGPRKRKANPPNQEQMEAAMSMSTPNNDEPELGNSSDTNYRVIHHSNPDLSHPVPSSVPGSSWNEQHQQYLDLSHSAQLLSRQYASLDLSQGSSYHTALQQHLQTMSSNHFPFPH